jgi:hypothetical protein
MKCLFEITEDMDINDVLATLQDLLINQYSFDWRQANTHPESFEACTWGSGNVIGRSKGSQKYRKLAEFYDSPDMMLAINAVRALPILMRYISTLQIQVICGNRNKP